MNDGFFNSLINNDKLLLGLFIFAAILFLISVVWLIIVLRKPAKSQKAPATTPTRTAQPVKVDAPPALAVVNNQSSAATLFLVDLSNRGWGLDPLPATIGRDRSNKIVLNDPKVSALHATIYFDKSFSAVCIEDNASLNGLFIDEFPTQKNLLYDNMKIRLGETIFTFQNKGFVPPSNS